MAKVMVAGVIYKAKRGMVYSQVSDPRRFNCYCPADYADGCEGIADCWVCDEHGNIDPGLCNCGVPIHVSALGETVGNMLAE